MSKVSDCCGCAPKGIPGPHGTVDCSTEEYGICPECGEHCEYIEEGEEEETETTNEENDEKDD